MAAMQSCYMQLLLGKVSYPAFLYRVAWPAVMKGWEQWRDVYSPEGQLLFAGLRAKVSVFHGQMTRIVPHTTTGHDPLQFILQLLT